MKINWQFLCTTNYWLILGGICRSCLKQGSGFFIVYTLQYKLILWVIMSKLPERERRLYDIYVLDDSETDKLEIRLWTSRSVIEQRRELVWQQ